MQRIVRPELLDDDLGTSAEIASSLQDLRRINRLFGGASTSAALVLRVAQERRLHRLAVLDVGGATGDVAQAAGRALATHGIELRSTIADRSPKHLGADLPALAADAFALPFPDNSFDVVHCGLLLHQMEPDEIRRFAGEALRVARLAFVANDLRRHAMHLALVYSGMPWLYRSRLTRHDAPVSVRRSYTEEEMSEILKRTPAARVEITRHYLFRMGVVAWKT